MSNNIGHTGYLIMERNLKNKFITPEFDYIYLTSCLSNYTNPRDKICRMIRNGDIIRVKKGLYVLGDKESHTPYSKELLANLIYGPSYISCEYALAYYGLIPERVETLTSITSKRNKSFQTPVGFFLYRYLNLEKYATGITQAQIDETRSILIATKEKALADLIWFSKQHSIENMHELESFLYKDLRLDENEIKKINLTKIKELSQVYNITTLKLLREYIKKGNE